jgi:hypothetical protein
MIGSEVTANCRLDQAGAMEMGKPFHPLVHAERIFLALLEAAEQRPAFIFPKTFDVHKTGLP